MIALEELHDQHNVSILEISNSFSVTHDSNPSIHQPAILLAILNCSNEFSNQIITIVDYLKIPD